MKKWMILLGLALALTALLLAGCQDRGNTSGTDMSGSDNAVGSAISGTATTAKRDDTSRTSEQGSLANGVGDAGNALGDAAKDTADDLGSAAKDIVSGAGEAVGDVVDGAGDAVKDADDAMRNDAATEKATVAELTAD